MKKLIFSNELFVLLFAYFVNYIAFDRFYLAFFVTGIPFTLVFSTLLCLLIQLFKNKKKATAIIVFLWTAYSAVCIVFYRVFGFGFRIRQLSIFKELFATGNATSSNILARDFLLLIPLCIYLLLWKKWIFLNKAKRKVSAITLAVFIVLFFFCGKTCFSASGPYHVLEAGVQTNLYFDLYASSKEMFTSNEVSQEELSSFINEYSGQENNEFTGMLKDKNLILILCESLDDYVISPELTPTLYMMSKEGIYFENYNSPLYDFHTVDSEFVVLTGEVPSLDRGVTNYEYRKNSFPSGLAHLFNKNGYNVNSYHNYLGSYYNRDNMHPLFGFDELYDSVDMGFETEDFYSMSDIDLFKSIDIGDEKFFKYVVTLSMHGLYTPYKFYSMEEYGKVIDSSSYKDENNEMKEYLARAMIFDKGLEILLNRLEEANKLEDTVLILFSDHYPYTFRKDVNKEKTCSDYNTVLLIYNTELESQSVAKPCSVEDVYPTITNLFGLDNRGYYKFGVDIFSDRESLLIDFKKLPKDEEKKKTIERIHSVSQYILQTNYYRED